MIDQGQVKHRHGDANIIPQTGILKIMSVGIYHIEKLDNCMIRFPHLHKSRFHI